VVGIVLVTTTTTLVGREWTALPDEEPVPLRPFHNEPVEPTEDGEDREEDGTENSQENLNVLHLLYTIAQVFHLIRATADDRTKHIKTDSYIEGFRVISVTKSRYEGSDITV
jgi:hypothetical protein